MSDVLSGFDFFAGYVLGLLVGWTINVWNQRIRTKARRVTGRGNPGER